METYQLHIRFLVMVHLRMKFKNLVRFMITYTFTTITTVACCKAHGSTPYTQLHATRDCKASKALIPISNNIPILSQPLSVPKTCVSLITVALPPLSAPGTLSFRRVILTTAFPIPETHKPMTMYRGIDDLRFTGNRRDPAARFRLTRIEDYD